ncbi:MAG: phosphoribosylaminoimidazolesuccinocarboxamide synthase [Candidatus Ranarchaeia archaeon]
MLSQDDIQQQLSYTLKETDFPLGKKIRGKVRDNYILGNQRFLIATDRVSAFDRVITTLPFKGQILNEFANYWFERTKDIVDNHILATPDPNVVVAKECRAIPVEVVIRGYITGVTKTSAWYNYEQGVRDFCGNMLPEGLKKNQKFDTPIITPTTKAERGEHDENLSPSECITRGLVTQKLMDDLTRISFKLYERGVKLAAEHGMILVDTKYEFGMYNGEITLIDEVHTPDSSRYWFADDYTSRFDEGKEPRKIDKAYFREWLVSQGYRGDGPIPHVLDEIRVESTRRYMEAYETITGEEFHAEVGEVNQRIENNLRKNGYLK